MSRYNRAMMTAKTLNPLTIRVARALSESLLDPADILAIPGAAAEVLETLYVRRLRLDEAQKENRPLQMQSKAARRRLSLRGRSQAEKPVVLSTHKTSAVRTAERLCALAEARVAEARQQLDAEREQAEEFAQACAAADQRLEALHQQIEVIEAQAGVHLGELQAACNLQFEADLVWVLAEFKRATHGVIDDLTCTPDETFGSTMKTLAANAQKAAADLAYEHLQQIDANNTMVTAELREVRVEPCTEVQRELTLRTELQTALHRQRSRVGAAKAILREQEDRLASARRRLERAQR